MRNDLLLNSKKEKIPTQTIYYKNVHNELSDLAGVLFINSYPPRECGLATYSQDLVKCLKNKFDHSFRIKICALESDFEKHTYTDEVSYVLNTDTPGSFSKLANDINSDQSISMVMIQHEFGFFVKKETEFCAFLQQLKKPVIIVFHSVLPEPGETIRLHVKAIAVEAVSIVVMTQNSANILIQEYGIQPEKITVIPHGTHLVPYSDKIQLKKKYNLTGKKVLSTFGLLSSGKSLETTLEALPEIIQKNKDVLFLIIGKTHPSVVKQEGEQYREMLEKKIVSLQIQPYVQFVNYFLPLPDLLEYLQLTDIYLFTSKDPAQAVSGTFSYAISCGCPIISTPIPHAREVLNSNAGIMIDFNSPGQLAAAVDSMLNDEKKLTEISLNGIHMMAPTAWENAAIAHAILFQQISSKPIKLHYHIPYDNFSHIKKMTTNFGMIQFARINQPDIHSGYTLDDNARSLIAFCKHYELSKNTENLVNISTYFNFIQFCMQPNGHFLNYVNEQKEFTEQNNTTNLEDSNGRAIWAIGYLLSLGNRLPIGIKFPAELLFKRALKQVDQFHSTRAMAFIIKGIYYSKTAETSPQNKDLIRLFANRLVQMYRHESEKDWHWFESYLTYANSVLPESLLCAWLATGENLYKEIARNSFDFLLSKIFKENKIQTISNKGWLHRANQSDLKPKGGEQPIDVSYTIMALSKFYDVYCENDFLEKMHNAFNWFQGDNHLHQIMYNPCTGGCYDGLEENYINLNQGAESTVSYFMASLTLQKVLQTKKSAERPVEIQMRTYYPEMQNMNQWVNT